jgi:hypothetical protein
VDPHVVLILLAGALGVHDDEEPPVQPAALARHSALLIAHLLGTRPLKEVLTMALGEIERVQLND